MEETPNAEKGKQNSGETESAEIAVGSSSREVENKRKPGNAGKAGTAGNVERAGNAGKAGSDN